jgi:shikimate kinase
LGPRLNGANLYLVGMMGSGKSAVGDVVAKRKFVF